MSQQLQNMLVQLIVTLATTGGGVLGTWLTVMLGQFISHHVKSKKMQNVLNLIVMHGGNIVRELEQTEVATLKASGNWNPATQANVKNTAMNKLRAYLTPTNLDAATEHLLGGDGAMLTPYLATVIESLVHQMGGPLLSYIAPDPATLVPLAPSIVKTEKAPSAGFTQMGFLLVLGGIAAILAVMCVASLISGCVHPTDTASSVLLTASNTANASLVNYEKYDMQHLLDIDQEAIEHCVGNPAPVMCRHAYADPIIANYKTTVRSKVITAFQASSLAAAEAKTIIDQVDSGATPESALAAIVATALQKYSDLTAVIGAIVGGGK